MGPRLDRLTRLVAFLGFGALVAIALATMCDAAMRYLGIGRITGFEDFQEVAFALVIATCFPAGLMQGHNVTIRFLGRAVSPRAQAWIETFGALVTLIFFALLVWQFVLLTADLQHNGRVTGTLELPVAPWWWATTAVMALTLPVQAYVVGCRWHEARTGEAPAVIDQMTSEAG